MNPEDRQQWDSFHRFACNEGSEVLRVTGFEDRDTVERFAGFAAPSYQIAGWDDRMDVHGVVDDSRGQGHQLV